MTHLAVQRAKKLANAPMVGGTFRDALSELVEAYETLEARYDEALGWLGDEEDGYVRRRAEEKRVVALNTQLTAHSNEQADELLNRDGEVIELRGQVGRLTTALRNVMTLVDTDDIWRASGFAKDARALLAETTET